MVHAAMSIPSNGKKSFALYFVVYCDRLSFDDWQKKERLKMKKGAMATCAYLAFDEVTNNLVVEVVDGRPLDPLGHVLFLEDRQRQMQRRWKDDMEKAEKATRTNQRKSLYLYLSALFVQLPSFSFSCASSSRLSVLLVTFPSFSVFPTPNQPHQNEPQPILLNRPSSLSE